MCPHMRFIYVSSFALALRLEQSSTLKGAGWTTYILLHMRPHALSLEHRQARLKVQTGPLYMCAHTRLP